MKEYILKAKDRRKEIRCGEKERKLTEQDVKNEKDRILLKKANFLIDEFHRVADEMILEFSKDKENVSDEEILRRKENLSENLLNVDRLSDKLQKVLQVIPAEFFGKKTKIAKMEKAHQKVIEAKKVYEQHLQNELATRELMKEKLFNTSALNIHLQKFKGYESVLDIYSFQSEFEKLLS